MMKEPTTSSQPQIHLVWESDEHIELADDTHVTESKQTGFLWLSSHHLDLKDHEKPAAEWPAFWKDLYQKGTPEQRRMLTQGLTYGEISALAGDFYETIEHLNQAPLQEIYELIPLLRNRKTTTTQFQKVTAGRYLSLAEKNKQHFSKGNPDVNNLKTWKTLHLAALEAAREQNTNWAWILHAASVHYLTDAFAGGHLRVQREKLMNSTVGHIHSKILHDLDNNFGVMVNNQNGDGPWIAFGDGHLQKTENYKNKELLHKAILLAKQDIKDALVQGKSYPISNINASFSVEKLIPFAIDQMDNSRWKESSSILAVADEGLKALASTALGHPNSLNLIPKEVSAYRDQIFSIANKEIPSITRRSLKDDDDVRAWIEKYDTSILSRQPTEEKIRLLKVLLSGWVSKDDEQAIAKMMNSVSSKNELTIIQEKIIPHLGTFLRNKQKERIKRLFSKENGKQ